MRCSTHVDQVRDLVSVPCGLSHTALLLLVLLPGPLAGFNYRPDHQLLPIKVEVQSGGVETYDTEVAFRGILLGALRRLMASGSGFTFTYTEDPNYGPYLESVNGLYGNPEDHTFWELLVETPDGQIKRPDVGIGCYLPKENEKIILKFSKWGHCSREGEVDECY